LDDAQISALAAWITEVGLAGCSQTELLDGFCARATAAGLPLAFGMLLVDTLHPRHEGRAVRWFRGKEATIAEYGRTTTGEARRPGGAASSIACSPPASPSSTGA